jgi:conjugal transfer/entry exclusion protein
MPQLPLNLNQPVKQYFEFVQGTVDLNRELATRWAELVNTMTGAARERAESFSRIVKDQADTLAGLAAHQAQKTERAAQNQAEYAEQVAKEQTRQAQKAERDQAKQDRAKAREPYEDMTKAELSDELAYRGPPETGNVSALIDRLVQADTK